MIKYITLAISAASVLMLELALIRIYSITQGYHFAFFSISIAMLGSGTSGIIVYLISHKIKNWNNFIIISSFCYTFSLPFMIAMIKIIPFDIYKISIDPLILVYFITFCFVQLIPFILSGLIFSGAIYHWRSNLPMIYASLLVGSGIGAILGIIPYFHFASFSLIIVAGILASISSCVFLILMKPWKIIIIVPLIITLAIFLLLQGLWGEIPISPYKSLSILLQDRETLIEKTTFRPISRIDILESPNLHSFPGLSFHYSGKLPDQRGITIDGNNLNVLNKIPFDQADFTSFLPNSIGLSLYDHPNVLLIEPKGDTEIISTLFHGADNVTALVSDSSISNALSSHIKQFGNADKVEIINTNPRAFLNNIQFSYDVILIAPRNSFRPIKSGTYSLLEEGVITVEAIQTYLDTLEENGILIFHSWTQTPPSEEFKILTTAVSAMEKNQLVDVNKKLVAIRTLQTMTFLVSKQDWTIDQILKIQAFTENLGIDIAYSPLVESGGTNRFAILNPEPYYPGIKSILDQENRKDFLLQYEFNIEPVTDRKPFLFNFFKWSQFPVIFSQLGTSWEPFGGLGFLLIIILFIIMVITSFLFMFGPLLIAKFQNKNLISKPLPKIFFYFFLTGFGFMCIEIPLFQMLISVLGNPIYSFAFVVSSLLIFSGIGSALYSKVVRYVPLLFILIPIICLIFHLKLNPQTILSTSDSLFIRTIFSCIIIAPLGLMTGIVFPAGMDKLVGNNEKNIPWAWAINGFASVISSVFAAILALNVGLSNVLGIAGIAYFVSWMILIFFGYLPSKRHKPHCSLVN